MADESSNHLTVCGARTKVGGVTVTCFMSGHTKPEAIGPVHKARGPNGTIVSWPVRGREGALGRLADSHDS